MNFASTNKVPSGVIALASCAAVAGLLGILFGKDTFSGLLVLGTLTASVFFTDTVKAVRGEYELIDAGAIVGVLGLFIFLISPVSQLAWDYWPFLPSLGEDVKWITMWAALNFFGSLVYLYAIHGRGVRFRRRKSRPQRIVMFNHKRFVFPALIALAASAVCQAQVYLKFGGISGFLNAFTERQAVGAVNYDPFEGMGLLMVGAESFKYVFAMLAIYVFGKNVKSRRVEIFVLLMGVFVIVFMLFGGLRGSRSSTLFSLFFAAGMYHFYIKRLSMKIVGMGMAVLFIFMTSYYWYKIAGMEGVTAIFDEQSRRNFSESRQDVGRYVVARDLGRMDMQTLALKRRYEDGFDFVLGRTYATSLFASMPKAIIPYSPAQITKEKTELIHGRGSYYPNEPRQTTLVLGQFGESFINFGVLGVLVFYLGLGMIVRRSRQLAERLAPEDTRRLLLPLVVLVPSLLLITDMNVVLMQLMRHALFPVILFTAAIKFRFIQQSPREVCVTTQNPGALKAI